MKIHLLLAACVALMAGFAGSQETAEPESPETLPPTLSPHETAPPTETAEVDLVEIVPAQPAPEGQTRAGRISVTLDNVPIQDVLRLFVRLSGANIVAKGRLEGEVTASLQDVEWEPALRSILDRANLVLVEKTPGIYTVMSKKDLQDEPLTVETFTLRYITVSNALPVVQRMLVSSNASATGAAAANVIVVRETADQLAKIREVIGRMDRPREQVFIEAKFVELNDQALRDLGINWRALQSYSVGVGGLRWSWQDERQRDRQSTTEWTDSEKRQTSDILHRDYDEYGVLTGYEKDRGLASYRDTRETYTRDLARDRTVRDDYLRRITDVRAAVLSADDFALVLSALKQKSGVSIVSNPKIVVASGEEALIEVGTKRPNISAKAMGSVDGAPYFVYEFQGWIDVGVSVRVTPIVHDPSNITVRIRPELSRAPRADDEVIPQTGQRFPVKTISTLETEFSIPNNRTVAIGGLSLTDDGEKVTKIPILGDLPIIGRYLFRHTSTQKVQNEIVIFLTVALARPESLYERAGIPSEGRLIHRHLTTRENLEVRP